MHEIGNNAKPLSLKKLSELPSFLELEELSELLTGNCKPATW